MEAEGRRSSDSGGNVGPVSIFKEVRERHSAGTRKAFAGFRLKSGGQLKSAFFFWLQIKKPKQP